MRKLFAIGLVLALTGLAAGCGKSTKRDNIEPPAELMDFTPTVKVTTVWSHSLGKGEKRLGLRQRPTIDGNVLYAADPSGKLYAFNADNGAQIWRVDVDASLSSSPGIGAGTVVVGTLDGELIAFNPDTGSERWRAKVTSEVISAPVVGHGLAIVRTIDGRISAFSITDGERRWVHDHGTPALTLRGNSAPVIADDLVMVGFDDGQLVALRIEDGGQLWEQPIAFAEGRTELDRTVDIDGELAFDRGELFAAAYNSDVVALSLSTGRPMWNRELSSYAGVSLSDEHVYVADRDGVLWALDRNSGAAMWKQDGLSHRWLTTPAVIGNHVVVGDVEGYLHWFDTSSGEPAARVRLSKKPILATPQVGNGLVYAVSSDGKLAVYQN